MSRYFYFFLVLSVSGAAARGSTIISENFNELTAQLGVTAAGAFTAIDGTNVDIVGPGNGFAALCASPASGNCVDLDGTGGNPQGILQSAPIPLSPGVDYFLSFDLTGSGRGNSASATVTFGSYARTFTLASGDVTSGAVTNALVTVTSPTTANLEFTSNTPGQIGLILDNVLLTSAPVVPEPATISLIGPALLLFAISGGIRLYRRRAAVRLSSR